MTEVLKMSYTKQKFNKHIAMFPVYLVNLE